MKIESCIKLTEDLRQGPFIMVIFGGKGDLSLKKLVPTLYNLYKKKLINNFVILGLSYTPISLKEYHSLIKDSLKKYTKSFDEKTFQKFIKKIHYLSADLTKESSYKDLCHSIDKYGKDIDNLIYYVALPPKIVPDIIKCLSNDNLCKKKKQTKIIIEKPFGNNEKSAKKLNKDILSIFSEDQIYRIDHYLGKETVQNIMFFRFANTLFEPIWNRNYIDHIQITVAEDIGIERRGVLYEQSGIIKDMIQNHIMQLIALVAMDPPVNYEAESIRRERVKLLQSIKIFSKEDVAKNIVLGQYKEGMIQNKKVVSYQKEKNVKKGSKIPTFFAGKFFIDSWRWADVPFYVRAGKRLKKSYTEIIVQFKFPPLKLLGHTCSDIISNTFVFDIYPNQKISLLFNVKYPGLTNIPYPVDMIFDYKKTFKRTTPLAYERLLIDFMRSDATLFARKDGIETMWRIVDPIISNWDPKNLHYYKAGTYGPKESIDLIKRDNRDWRVF